MKRLASNFSRGLVIAAACALLGSTAVGCGDDDDEPGNGKPDGGDRDGSVAGTGGKGGKGGTGGTAGTAGKGGTGGSAGSDPDIDGGPDDDAGN